MIKAINFDNYIVLNGNIEHKEDNLIKNNQLTIEVPKINIKGVKVMGNKMKSEETQSIEHHNTIDNFKKNRLRVIAYK